MGRIESQKRKLIEESNKRLLGESSYSGIIKKGDDICEIICKRKIAKEGSSGDVVKMIQHLLDSNGFNVGYEGGGMKSGCSQEWPSCDGIFKSHTKDAVKEFQRKFMGSTSDDGVVGYNTWKSMCKNLDFTISLPKSKFCKDCQCGDNQQDDNSEDLGDYDQIEIPGGGTLPIDSSGQPGGLGDIDCKDLRLCVEKWIYGPLTPNLGKFMSCISGKNTPKPDKPVRKDCEGCPKYVWGGYQVAGGGDAYWKRKKLESECLKNQCSIFTRDEKLMEDNPELFK